MAYNSKTSSLASITLWMPKELLVQLREKARAELGEMPSRNGDAAAPTVLRRLVELYVAGGLK